MKLRAEPAAARVQLDAAYEAVTGELPWRGVSGVPMNCSSRVSPGAHLATGKRGNG